MFRKIFSTINNERRKEVDMPNSLNNTKNRAGLCTDVELITTPGNSAVADVTRDRKGLNEVPAVSAVRGRP